MFKSIMVLEATWDSTSVESYSVFPLVDVFARVCGVTVYHQTFTDKRSFSHWVRIFDKSKAPKPRLLYLASHGGIRKIEGLRQGIEFNAVRRACRSATGIKYVHFGTCYFGNRTNLSKLLRSCNQLRWVAGYDTSADWIEGIFVDLLLWRHLLIREKNRGKKFQSIVKELAQEHPWLVQNTGFQFQYRCGGVIKHLDLTTQKP